mgnify:CR=1 FL=1
MIGFIMHGIVGFLRILEENKKDFAIKKDNYIEFDTEDLRNFHEYYFEYFSVIQNIFVLVLYLMQIGLYFFIT